MAFASYLHIICITLFVLHIHPHWLSWPLGAAALDEAEWPSNIFSIIIIVAVNHFHISINPSYISNHHCDFPHICINMHPGCTVHRDHLHFIAISHLPEWPSSPLFHHNHHHHLHHHHHQHHHHLHFVAISHLPEWPGRKLREARKDFLHCTELCFSCTV